MDAGVVEHQVEVVVAAEGVVPGQPVDDHRRLVADEAQAHTARLHAHDFESRAYVRVAQRGSDCRDGPIFLHSAFGSRPAAR